MPKIRLDDHLAKRLTPPAEGFAEYTDDRLSGFKLRVFASGKISGSYRYAPLGSTKKKRYPLGEYPATTISEMRRKGESIRVKARDGADPAAERDAIRDERRREETDPALTFDHLCDLYLPQLAKRKSSWDQDKGYLARDARPQWGSRKLEHITRADCAQRLLEVAARAPVAANRLRAALLSFFNWAVDQGLLQTSPMRGIKKPTREKKEGIDRTLSDPEFVVLWRAIDNATLAPGLRAALKVLALTGQRPNEIAGLERSELRFLDDPKQALAEIPAARMKGRKKHVWPVSEPVALIIQEQIARQVEDARVEGHAIGNHIFTSRFMDRERIARHSLSQALRRIIPTLDAKGEDAEIVQRLQADPPTPHAFRRTCVSGLARLGIPREDRKAVVAHAETDVLAGHYDAYDRLREKRIALEAWGRHVEGLLSGEQRTGDVIPLRARA